MASQFAKEREMLTPAATEDAEFVLRQTSRRLLMFRKSAPVDTTTDLLFNLKSNHVRVSYPPCVV